MSTLLLNKKHFPTQVDASFCYLYSECATSY